MVVIVTAVVIRKSREQERRIKAYILEITIRRNIMGSLRRRSRKLWMWIICWQESILKRTPHLMRTALKISSKGTQRKHLISNNWIRDQSWIVQIDCRNCQCKHTNLSPVLFQLGIIWGGRWWVKGIWRWRVRWTEVVEVRGICLRLWKLRHIM